jgi:diguanylate cyclase (GGDEF)-like protein
MRIRQGPTKEVMPVYLAPTRSLGLLRVAAIALSALLCVGSVIVAIVAGRLLAQQGADATMLLVGTAVVVTGSLGLLLVFFVGSSRYQRRLRVASTTDALTDLPNRGSFLQRATLVLQESIDQAASAVMLIDVDHLKAINDALGNEAGDRLLAAVGPRLATVLRPDDLVGRLGGDEFAVLIRGTRREEDIASIADRLVAALYQPFHRDRGKHRCGHGSGECHDGCRLVTAGGCGALRSETRTSCCHVLPGRDG